MSGIVLGARGSGSPELASTTSWGLLEATGRRFRIRQAHPPALPEAFSDGRGHLEGLLHVPVGLGQRKRPDRRVSSRRDAWPGIGAGQAVICQTLGRRALRRAMLDEGLEDLALCAWWLCVEVGVAVPLGSGEVDDGAASRSMRPWPLSTVSCQSASLKSIALRSSKIISWLSLTALIT